MRVIVLFVLLGLAPLGAAYPDSGPDAWPTFEGVIAQGERDIGDDWLDLWMGHHGWECTTSIEEDVFILTLLDGATGDRLTLETGASTGGRLRTEATSLTPAILYGQSDSGCRDFAVEGTSVATTARYRVEFTNEQDLLCRTLC